MKAENRCALRIGLRSRIFGKPDLFTRCRKEKRRKFVEIMRSRWL